MAQNPHELGTGVLNWSRYERIGDRYGAIHLAPAPEADPLPLSRGLEGQHVRLIALVRECRDSPHVGDLYHGFFPATPAPGERILLGKGVLFFEDDTVGVLPDDGRETFWMDPPMLYRAHYQTVTLIAEPQDGSAA